MKQDRIWPEYFANLAWLLDKNNFYSLQKKYARGVIDATPDVRTRIKRNGQMYEVGAWGGEPFDLWVIERAIQSTVSDLEWSSTEREPECPRWEAGEIKEFAAKK